MDSLIAGEQELAQLKNSDDNKESDNESDHSLSSSSSQSETYASTSQTSLRSRTMTLMIDLDEIDEEQTNDILSGNPENWNWPQVKLWLKSKQLKQFIDVFDVKREDRNDIAGIEGEELLDLTSRKLFDNSDWDAEKKLGIGANEASTHPLIERFMREITKLQLQANQIEHDPETTLHDLNEMERRVTNFMRKWDDILWIGMFEETNNRLPKIAEIIDELEISDSVASVYLEIYESLERQQNKDLNELLIDFNVYEDCVIWWFIIISKLKTYPSKALWPLFEKVAEITPGNVAIALLEEYRYDLTRFKAENLDKVCQNIVIGSGYPICAALRIAKWFLDTGEYDVARAELFENIASSYIDSANDYLKLVESDHLATLLLEVKSDIDGKSALDMALDYHLHDFVSTNRVERVTNSIMNNFEFLHPKKRDEAFEIEPITLELVWRKMFEKEFYFTPVGLFVTSLTLYLCYLALFTYLSTEQTEVYDKLTTQEIVFWVLNFGYILNEVQQVVSAGPKQYFASSANRFEALVAVVFTSAFVLRMIGANKDCSKADDCPTTDTLSTTFVVLWSIATITLWLNLINFCVLSRKLGPMVTMMFNMAGDIVTFFEIMLIAFIGFSFALMFILGREEKDFSTPFRSALTLFTAILSGFDLSVLQCPDDEEEEDCNEFLLYFAYAMMTFYLIIGSLVLLNLLIAMMATTYDQVTENATTAIVFARFELAINLDRSASFMPPPLNVIAIVLFFLFNLIEKCMDVITACLRCYKKDIYDVDLAMYIMPKFCKNHKLEFDDQVLWKNCQRSWIIETHRGPTRAKAVKYDYHLHQHYVQFYDTNGFEDDEDHEKWTVVNVSVQGDVAKKSQWLLDLMELCEEGLMDIAQFEDIEVNREWTIRADLAMEHAEENNLVSPYWICAYCRSYVKESSSAVNVLGRLLKVHDIEMKLIHKVSPVVCPNCYRARFERNRWEAVWEILSLYVFYIFVWPLLFVLVGSLILFKKMRNPVSFAESAEHAVDTRILEHEFDDLEEEEKIQYVAGHYKDKELIAKLQQDETEHQFFSDERSHVWEKLHHAKDAIDPYLLKRKIEEHIVSLSTEDELTLKEFLDDFVNADELVADTDEDNPQHLLVDNYFKPLAHTLFLHIHRARGSHLPLHKFSRYPFDIHEVMDDLEGEIVEVGQRLDELTKEQLLQGLKKLEFLNCANDNERNLILNAVDSMKEWHNVKKNEENKFFPKFFNYLSEVVSLFQSTRKIKNLLRDVKLAITERGIDAKLYADQLYFVFDDVKNAVTALPFFNSLRTEEDNTVSLWTIRNTLRSLYFMNHAVRKKVLKESKKIYVSVDQLLDIIFRMFREDIVDPDGITDFLNAEDSDDESEDAEENDDFDDDDDDEVNIGAPMLTPVLSSANLSHQFSRANMSTQFSTANLNLSKLGDVNDLKESKSVMIQNNKKKEEELKELQHRLDLFRKGQITAKQVKTEVTAIFDALQTKRKFVTEGTIDYYRRIGLQHAALLQNDEWLTYTYEQLARYITFHPKEATKLCTLDDLKRILRVKVFNESEICTIDEQTIPLAIQDDVYVEQMYNQLNKIYKDTCSRFQGDIKTIKDGQTDGIHLEDVFAIVMLYHRVFMVVEDKIIESADEYVVNHDLFVTFVDREQFKIGSDRETWSDKSRAASNLYGNVLAIQQNFVTLGQVRQTVDDLLKDIDLMEAGALTRLVNYLQAKVDADSERCKEKRAPYKQKLRQIGVDDVTTMLSSNDADADADADVDMMEEKEDMDMDEEPEPNAPIRQTSTALKTGDTGGSKQSKARKRKKKIKNVNPGLQFEHVKERKWIEFIATLGSHLDDVTSKDIAEKNGTMPKENDILNILLCNARFDIIINEENKRNENNIEEKDEMNKKKSDAAKKKKARYDVFDTILSFNSKRITLQQLFGFAVKFRKFLRLNATVNELMRKYDNVIEDGKLVEELKKKRMPKKFEQFKQNYFGRYNEKGKAKVTPLKEFIAEIKWLHERTDNEYMLCTRIYPFWSETFIREIHTFMESTENIQGDYELKAAEFGQLKYSMGVDQERALKLFNIVRFKTRSLSWSQLYNFFFFILMMKYSVHRAILLSKQAEDTTVSEDAMKMMLKIQMNDESEWLFEKVLQDNASKVTWKQIRKYLSKVVKVRDQMRDFFNDQQRDRDYEENTAEMICSISDQVGQAIEKQDEGQDNVMDLLRKLTQDIEQIKQKLSNE